ncbi:copper chaperone PCu(A)C [Lysobacter sp. KIS68-7]|uniref:copper chaperone PCu(A)C n=1 Tax=Lysobacter sp. KIS68-7 TaxID=2904252 RepID=UPI001E6338A8|nr:copper chaperone PCu(A)C [Lysobacter sp. KIS68-7]UHQ18566.1 copper chaperone PCu(A)C [Lysobacter sp. KIS68-7]
MEILRRATFALILAASAVAPACAKGKADCVPVVREGWIRLVPGGMPMHAGFGRIENKCAMPATIVGARSPAYDSAELHETKIVDGVNRMRAVPELRIAPDDAAVLKPGGLHLMLMDPHAPLKVGSKVVIEFPLQDGRVVRGEFDVRAPDAVAP